MAHSPAKYDHLLKILIIGDQAVGKTCVLLQFSDEKFAPSQIATIGIDFKVKMLSLKSKVLKLQIWDTAGQERFRNITQTYYKGAMGILLAYDCTNRDSFGHVKDWMQQIHEHANPDVVVALVANKVDMVDARVVTPEEGRALSEEMNVLYFETSAKTGHNIEDTFHQLASTILDRGLCEKYGYSNVRVKKPAPKKARCCDN